MARDHFSQMMRSPYFQSDHYRNEFPAGIKEKLFFEKVDNFFARINFWKRKKNV